MLYRVSFDLKQTRKIKNPAQKLFVLNDTHYNNINRYNIEGYVTA